MNPQALHLDEAWSAQQPFGQRLVNSLFTLSTLVGLSVAQLTQGTIVANLGFRDVVSQSPSSTVTRSTPRPSYSRSASRPAARARAS